MTLALPGLGARRFNQPRGLIPTRGRNLAKHISEHVQQFGGVAVAARNQQPSNGPRIETGAFTNVGTTRTAD